MYMIRNLTTIHDEERDKLMLCLFPGPADSFDQILFSDLFAAGEIAWGDLSVDLNARVGGNQVVYT